jgi:ABC-2 type transport system permease protein
MPRMRIPGLFDSRELLRAIVQRELRGRYRRSRLGMVWSLAHPLMSIAVYALVFRYLLKFTPGPGDPSGLDVFALWVLCGLLPWLFFANTTTMGMRAIVDNQGLVKNVLFDRETLIFGFVGAQVLTFTLELSLLLGLLLLAGNLFLPWLPMLVVVVACLTVFTAGVTLLLAASYVYFRDLQYLWSICTQLGFFAAPIVYPIGLLPDRLQTVVRLNPITAFVTSVRNLVYDLRGPTAFDLTVMVCWSVTSLLIGLGAFSRLSPRFAEEL